MPWSDKWMETKTDWDKNVEDFCVTILELAERSLVGYIKFTKFANFPTKLLRGASMCWDNKSS